MATKILETHSVKQFFCFFYLAVR